MNDSPIKADTKTNELKLTEEIKNLSLSPTPSIYLTPRDSLENNTNNLEFLKEISHAINAPSPMTSYHSAVNQSNLLENTFLKKIASNLTCELDNMQPSLMLSPNEINCVKSPTYRNNDTFLDRVAKNKTFNLDTIQQTLIENTVIISDDEIEQNVPCNSLNISQDSLSFVSVKKEKLDNVKPMHLEKSVIEISSDESLSEEEIENEDKSYSEQDYETDSKNNSRTDSLDNRENGLQNESVALKEISDNTDTDITRDSQIDKNKKTSDLLKESEDSFNVEYSGKKNDASYNLEVSLTREPWEDNYDMIEEKLLELQKNDKAYQDSDQESEEYSFDLHIELDREDGEEKDVQNYVPKVFISDFDKPQVSTIVITKSVDNAPEHLSDYESYLSMTEPINECYSYKSAHSCSKIEHHSDNTTQSSVCSERSLESGIGPLNSTGKSRTSKLNNRIFNSSAKRSVSPVHVPEIQLEQFDDTLEEINQFLAQGNLDSIGSEKVCRSPLKTKTFKNNTPAKAVTSIPIFKSENKAVKSPLRTKPFNSAGHQQKYFDFGTTPKPPTKNRKNLFQFKVPSTPTKPITPNRGPKSTNAQFNHVQSPIGVYIKNAPRYTPMINVPKKEISSIPMSINMPAKTKSKENVPPNKLLQEIPPVVYRPSKTQLKTTHNEVNLPPSIRKMCPEPTVIRHEAKYTTKPVDVERKLELDENLTINSTVDSSLLNSAGHDVSVWTTTQAFIKN